MRTIREVAKLAGVSVRTLQYYDRIGLLKPVERSAAGYRLYDDAALERLQQIMLYRELQFPLKDIRRILDSPNYDRNRALDQQIELLRLRRQHLDNLIDFAKGIKLLGVNYIMSFEMFDYSRLDEYAERAKASWGTTPEYKEYAERSKNWSSGQSNAISAQMLAIFAEFGAIRDTDPASEPAQALAKKLQDFITDNLYTCSREVLSALARQYAGGGEMNANIDRFGGEGTGAFANAAIQIYCGKAGAAVSGD